MVTWLLALLVWRDWRLVIHRFSLAEVLGLSGAQTRRTRRQTYATTTDTITSGLDADRRQTFEPLLRLVAVAGLHSKHQRGGAWDVGEQLLKRGPALGKRSSPEIATAALGRLGAGDLPCPRSQGETPPERIEVESTFASPASSSSPWSASATAGTRPRPPHSSPTA
jgi:hypothetical protein